MMWRIRRTIIQITIKRLSYIGILKKGKSMKLRKALAAIAAGILVMPAAQADQAVAFMQQLNDALEASGEDIRISYLEYYTTADAEEMGRIVFADNRGNKQLGSQFVPGDTRRAWSADPNAITWSLDTFDVTGDVSLADQEAAHEAAMATWDAQTCSEYGLNRAPIPPGFEDTGFIQFLYYGGGSPFVFADIQHSGFLPGNFFDLLAPGGSNFILGVSFTFIWTEGGVPTDIDNNGYADKAIGDNYYNDNFAWSVDGSAYDIETVVLHEAGHGHGQAHFGSISRTVANGKLHFSPRAVMNAAYSGIQRSLTGTDRGGHCAQWANWPNN